MNTKTSLLLLILTLFSVGCNKINISFNEALRSSSLLEPKIAKVEVVNDQLILSGQNMENVKELTVAGHTHVFKVLSRTANQIIYAVEGSVALNINLLSNLIVSSAHASSNVPIAVSLCSVQLGGKEIDCTVAPVNGQVLAYDQTSNKWKPTSIPAGLNLVINPSEPYACDETKIGSIVLDPNGALCSCSRASNAGLAWRSFTGVCTFEKVKVCPSTLLAADAADKTLHTTYSCLCDPTTLGSSNSVYGDMIFSAKSSICQAAVFASRIDPVLGGQVYYSVLRGRGAYSSGTDYANGTISSNADTAATASFILDSITNGSTKYGCKEPTYTDSGSCYGAGSDYYFNGSGMFGTCYQTFDINQTPPCSDWEIFNLGNSI